MFKESIMSWFYHLFPSCLSCKLNAWNKGTNSQQSQQDVSHSLSNVRQKAPTATFPFEQHKQRAKKKPVITGSGLHLKQVKGGASRNFLLIDRIFNFYLIFTVN